MSLSNIQGFFDSRGNGLVVLRLAECGLREPLTLMELHRVMNNELVEAESRMAEVVRWKSGVCGWERFRNILF